LVAVLCVFLSPANANEFDEILDAETQISKPRIQGDKRYFVVLASYREEQLDKALEKAAEIRALIANLFVEVRIINTEDYENLRNGYLCVVIGPGQYEEMDSKKIQMKEYVTDCYVKSAI
jgi:hypothetical protein